MLKKIVSSILVIVMIFSCQKRNKANDSLNQVESVKSINDSLNDDTVKSINDSLNDDWVKSINDSLNSVQIHPKSLTEVNLKIKPGYDYTDVYFYKGKLYNGVAYENNGFGNKSKYYYSNGLIEKKDEFHKGKLIRVQTYYWELNYNSYRRSWKETYNNVPRPTADTVYTRPI